MKPGHFYLAGESAPKDISGCSLVEAKFEREEHMQSPFLMVDVPIRNIYHKYRSTDCRWQWYMFHSRTKTIAAEHANDL